MKNEHFISHSIERATAYLKSGFNCAQAVLLTYQQSFEMDFSSAYKVAGGFGGGMAQGEVCGAISGAIMLIGLQYSDIEDVSVNEEAKILTYRKSSDFIKAFKARHQFVRCRDLIGFDFSHAKTFPPEKAHRHHFDHCPQFVTSAVTLVSEILH